MSNRQARLIAVAILFCSGAVMEGLGVGRLYHLGGIVALVAGLMFAVDYVDSWKEER